MTAPRWLANRWTAVPGGFALLVLAWNGYVAFHNGGRVDGRVADAAGRSVAGATVTLFERSFVTHAEKQRTTTDASGNFRFEGNDNHWIQLEAEAAGLGRSERQVVRLWFRAQDTRVIEPLQLEGRQP